MHCQQAGVLPTQHYDSPVGNAESNTWMAHLRHSGFIADSKVGISPIGDVLPHSCTPSSRHYAEQLGVFSFTWRPPLYGLAKEGGK